MMNATFTAHEITVNGKTFPAEYSITPANTVFAFVTVQEENREPVNLRIKIDSADPNHAAALEAAMQAQQEARQSEAPTEEPREQQPIPVQPEPAPAAIPAPKAEIMPVRNQFVLVEPLAVESIPQTPAEPSSAAQAGETPAGSKQARGPVPEKLFVGLEIKGKGWEIFFDGGHERTRVIFKRKPVQAALDAVKKAGFFWSPTMKSWNKKLTHKAFRSAQALAVELRAICG